MASATATATSLSVETWVRFLVWLAFNVVVHLAYGRRHARLARGDRELAADRRRDT